MHHEVFLALLGVAGDVVEARADGFFVREALGFVSRPERAMLDRVLRLGFAFARLQRFVDAARHSSDGRWPSLYVRALAQGVERVMDRYADAVARLEGKVLAASVVFPIPSMMFELVDFAEVLPELAAFVGMLEAAAKLKGQETDGAREDMSQARIGSVCGGAVLLGELHKRSGSGFPRIRECFQQLLCYCHTVLYKQIFAWMLYGEVRDPYGEFFIKRIHPDTSGAPADRFQKPSIKTRLDPARDAMNWQHQFSIELNAVPTLYFPPAVAEKVFFIGKAIRILSHSNEFSPKDAQDIVQIMSNIARRREFDALALEQAVERIRADVASRLHDLVVVQSRFADFLETLKNYFLLARGEIFHAFIERSFLLMQQKPTTKSEADINLGIWYQTIREFSLVSGPDELMMDSTAAWTRRFYFQLPLQTFALRGFTSADGTILVGLSRTGRGSKSLAVDSQDMTDKPAYSDPTVDLVEGVAASGAVWWSHVQQDLTAFSTEFTAQLLSPTDNEGTNLSSLTSSASRHVALLIRNDNGTASSILRNGVFSIEQPAGATSVAIQLDFNPMTEPQDVGLQTRGDSIQTRTVCRIAPSRGGENSVVVSSPVQVLLESSPAAKGLLNVRIEYTRQEVQSGTAASSSTGGTPHVMYKKVVTIYVNDALVLQTPIDLHDALRLSAANGEYWIGLALSSGVSVSAWSLEKFTARSPPGVGSSHQQRLCNVSEPQPARELWRALSLHCDVPWPLRLLVTTDLVRSYGRVFQFCFRLKRIAYALEQVWKCDALRSSGMASMLRARMSFVVRNLELHFHVSVIESKFSQCMTQLGVATDFDRVKRIHETFVAGVVKGCYVHTKTVAMAIDEVLGVCWKFSEYILYQDSVGADVTTAGIASPSFSSDHIAALADEFHRRFEFLSSVLQIAEARELLFLLEFNEFFSAERERHLRQR